jgi:hypothetical protein
MVGSLRGVVSRGPVSLTQLHGYDDKAEEDLRSTGGMPLCLRIGVTGHRGIRDPDQVQQQVADAVRWLADELHLAEVSQHSPIWLQVITPLAAGGDQIAAEAVRNLHVAGTTLVVPVPSDDAAYVKSIRDDDQAAADKFESLRRERGTNVVKLSRATADDPGFRKVGQWVVDHCDVLVAMWDGKPPPAATAAGAPPGTAGIVSYALSHPREIPVIVVPVARSTEAARSTEVARSTEAARSSDTPEPDLPPRQLLARLEEANGFRSLWSRVRGTRGSEPKGLKPRLAIPSGAQDGQVGSDQEEREASFQRSIRSWPLDAAGGRVLRRNAIGITVGHLKRFNARQQEKTKNAFSELVDDALGSDAGPVPAAARKIDDWATARYERADALAKHYQLVSRLLDYSIYALAAISVIVAAIRAIWTVPGSAAAVALSVVDVCILLAISVIVVGDLRGRLRDGWVCFRAMAEYLRTYMFFALVEPRRKTSPGEEHRSLTSLGLNEFVGPAWFDRCMQAIWRHRPDRQASWTEGDLLALKGVLHGWIRDQEDYHRRSAENHAKLHQQFLIWVASLFIITVLVAFAHIFVPPTKQLDNALNFVAIGVPGVAAAINSIGAARDHHRHSVRSRAVMHLLSYQYLPAIMGADSLENLRKQADIMGTYILAESTDWYEVMAVHSVDIPT